MGAWEGSVRFFKWLALAHNLVPSLHVALSVVCVAVYARRAGLPGKMLLWLWAGVIAASTLLLHQHYLLDVLTGAALGWAGVRAVYDRWAACT
jgi:membrane-associated phospholipid phosphatase